METRDKRIETLYSLYREKYSPSPLLFSSPGRAEIVGNHTDHNRGKVLVSAISCDILALVSPRKDGIVEIVSAEAFPPIRFSASDLGSREREKGRSVALARGVLRYLKERGCRVGGFSAVTHSTVFRGAGVSSSAAFEVLIAEICNALFCGGTLAPLQKARAAQYAENVYYGKPCGLLDQCGIAFGGLNRIDFGGDDPAVEQVPPPEGYELVLVNTGGSHASLVSHYADIPREMGEVAAVFGKRVLREVSPDEFFGELPLLRKRVSDRAILRAVHFFEENERVDRAAAALKEGREDDFLACVRESGESSLSILQNAYVPGQTEQPLVLAHKLSERLLKRGAFRMMGGGFTGTLLAFCPQEQTYAYGGEMARLFGAENVYYTGLRQTGACRI